MGQVLKLIGTEDYASAEGSASPQTPHPRLVLSQTLSEILSVVEGSRVEGSPACPEPVERAEGATDAPSRGIKFPISKSANLPFDE